MEHEKIHLKYMKNKLNVKTSSCTNAIYAEYGRFPLILKQKVQVLKYWKRLLYLPHDHVLKHACNCLKELEDVGKYNWCTYVHEIVKENGCEYVWETQSIDNCTFNLIKEKMFKKHMEKSMCDIQDSDHLPKLRTYKKIKLCYKQENYLSVIKDYRYIMALARFRISSHNLRIETGRYSRPKLQVEDRVCIYCDSQETEDEVHFLNRCIYFKNERAILYRKCSKYIDDLYDINDDMVFVQIMTSCEPNVILATAKYLFTCFNKRMQINA